MSQLGYVTNKAKQVTPIRCSLHLSGPPYRLDTLTTQLLQCRVIRMIGDEAMAVRL